MLQKSSTRDAFGSLLYCYLLRENGALSAGSKLPHVHLFLHNKDKQLENAFNI